VTEFPGYDIIWDVFYESKTGAEDVFLDCLVRHGAIVDLEYSGEEPGDFAKWVSEDGRLCEKRGRIVYD
jgi:hypothetical protein